MKTYASERSVGMKFKPEIKPTLSRHIGVLGYCFRLLAGSVVLLGLSRTQAITFSDGSIHTVDDATYANERITVENGTTVVIESGAVLGTSQDSSGLIYAYDTSSVIVQGGTFGGAGRYSGLIVASDSSTVIIHGGTFGSTGANSGQVYTYNSSTLTIDGGTFGGVGQLSGGLFPRDGSMARIAGGTLGGAGYGSGMLYVYNFSTVVIEGGAFGSTGSSSGLIYARDDATVSFRGSGFDTSSFNARSGGVLGVNFCSQSLQDVYVLLATGFKGTLDFAPCDTDNDGVPDDQDLCPGTPAGEVVDANGCSAAQLDADGDGVPDGVDLCPGTPAGEPVDADGCSASQLDSDGDGVSDAVDWCPNSDLRPTVWIAGRDTGVPNSFNGALVDANGCSLADEIAEQLADAAKGARNHGRFVSSMAHYLNRLAAAGIISRNDRGALMRGIGSARESQFLP